MVDENTAEKAWDEYRATQINEYGSMRVAFMAGRASRDTEVALLKDARGILEASYAARAATGVSVESLAESLVRLGYEGLRAELAERTASADAYSKSLAEQREQAVLNETRLREQGVQARTQLAKVNEQLAEAREESGNHYRNALEWKTRAAEAQATIEAALIVTDDMRSVGWHIGKTVSELGDKLYAILSAPSSTGGN